MPATPTVAEESETGTLAPPRLSRHPAGRSVPLVEPSFPGNAILSPGEVLDDLYVVERVLGEGAIGQVYLARDTNLDRPVAVKLLREAHAGLEEHTERFHREAVAMSRVVHPNVVGIHALGQHTGRWYIAMEFVEGEDLEVFLQREGPLDPAKALSITRQVASGLAEAHALGIIHRDIKPSNILLRRLASGALLAKVVDFGLARTFDEGVLAKASVTMADAVVGTPQYMAPEQVQGAVLDGRADAYALACVFFTMVTGRPPFLGDSTIGVMLAHLNEQPPTLAQAEPERVWGVELEAELQRALAKQPEDRHDDIEAFIAALAATIEPLQAPSASDRSCGLCTSPARLWDRYCSDCGGMLPAATCPTCSTPQSGPGYTCVSCAASLLPSSQLTSTIPREHVGVALVARSLARPLPTDLAGTFTALVERERGRAVAVVGHEAVALFGLGGLFGRETESAMDVALALARRTDLKLLIGVEFGTLVDHGAGVAWHGAVVVDGAAVDGARAAARSLGERPGIAVADRAYRQIRGVYETERTDKVHRRVDARKNVPFGLATTMVHGFEVPLVGRDLELALLMRTAKKVLKSGGLSAVPIVGGAGLGKSRLVAEVLRRLEDDDSTLWRLEAGWCRPASLDTYGPLSQMLHVRLQLHNAPTEALLRDRLAALPGLSDDAGGPQAAKRLDKRVHALGRLIGLGQSKSKSNNGNVRPATDEERQAAFDVFTDYVRAACRDKPVVMLVGDLQWARRPTLDLLAAVVRECQDVPLLLLLPIRAEQADAMLEPLALPSARTVTLTLEHLDPDETRELASALVGGLQIPDDLAELIHAFSRGVPSQVEQAVDALTDGGVFTETSDGWVVAPDVAIDASLARPLDELVRMRLGRLTPSQRGILEAVSVCAHDAPRSLLASMLGRGVTEADLSLLVEQELLVRVRQSRFPGEREFAFRRRGLVDIVAATLTEVQRSGLLARAADWFMAYEGTRPPGFSALVGHYLLAADDTPRAARSMLDVAAEATLAFANSDALDAYETALELATEWHDGDPSDSAAIAALLSAALGQATLGLRLGRYGPALEAARVACALASVGGSNRVVEHVRALCLEGDLLEATGVDDEAIETYAEAETIAQQVPLARGLAAYAGGRRAMVLLKSRAPEEAERAARAVLTMEVDAGASSTQTDLHRGLGSAHGALGHLMIRRGDFEEARDHYATARQHRIAADDITGAAMASLAIGNVHYRSGDLGEARQAYASAIEACLEVGFARGVAVARTNLGNLLIDMSLPEEALGHLREAETWFLGFGEPNELAETARLIAQAQEATGAEPTRTSS